MADKNTMTTTEARTFLLDLAEMQNETLSPEHKEFAQKLKRVEEILSVQSNEVRYWKRATSYLAHCHAATAESECALKSVSKTKKRRYRDICKTAFDVLTESGATNVGQVHSNHEDGAKRCQQVVIDWEGV